MSQREESVAFEGLCMNLQPEPNTNQLISLHLGRKCHRINKTFHLNFVVNLVAGFPSEWGCKFLSQRSVVQMT